MACTAPINIDSTVTEPTCDLKCSFFYNYGNSSARISNNGNALSIAYDGLSDVVYNNETYTPSDILIFKPSLHEYDGQARDDDNTLVKAEIIVKHQSSTGSNLLISIPIVSGGGNVVITGGSSLITDLIDNAPDSSDDGVRSVSLSDFTLNSIIPKAPYYKYDGTFPYDCDSTQYTYLVFSNKSGGLSLDDNTIQKLGSYINEVNTTIYQNASVFYNTTGTQSNGFDGDGQIYIDCQPTGENGEVLYNTDASGNDLPLGGNTEYMDDAVDWVKNSIYFVIGVVLMLLITAFVSKYIFRRRTPLVAGEGGNVLLGAVGAANPLVNILSRSIVYA